MNMNEFIDTMIYCQVSRYAEIAQQNCLTKKNQRKFESATDFVRYCEVLGHFGSKNHTRKINNNHKDFNHKDFELHQVFMHTFLGQTVLIFSLYILLTIRTTFHHFPTTLANFVTFCFFSSIKNGSISFFIF